MHVGGKSQLKGAQSIKMLIFLDLLLVLLFGWSGKLNHYASKLSQCLWLWDRESKALKLDVDLKMEFYYIRIYVVYCRLCYCRWC